MNFEQNLESNTPQILNQQKIQFTEKMGKFDQVYDDDFVALINGLNESIKEYYKVSKNNIQEANSFILFYEKQGIAIQKLMEEIVKTNSYEKINEFFEQIPKINEIMSQLQLNANSNEKNLNLFFEDAKILFKKMRMKRKQKMIELSKNNNENNNDLNDSFANSFNYKKSNYLMKNNILGNNNINNNRRPIKSSFRKIQPSNSNSSLITINNIYSQIIKILTNFSEFNFMINKVNFEASSRFSNLQNNLKNELDKLMNLVRNIDKQNLNQNQNQRSRSIPSGINKELEKFKKMNQINEKKIYDLEINNNNLNLQLIKSQQLIRDKDNLIRNYENNNKGNVINNNNNMLNKNLNNLIKQKDMQINDLQQQIYIYQNNENLLNNQINDLNNKFQTKLNQFERLRKIQNSGKTNTNNSTLENYEQTIQNLNNEINNYKQLINNYENQIRDLSFQNNMNNMNNNLMSNSNPNFALQNKIEMLNREMQMKESEYIKEREMIKNRNAINEQKLNQTISNDNKKIEELKIKINQLNKEIINNKRKQNIFEDNNNKYAKQIEEMNNNILSLNQIIEQKDKLISQLNSNRNNELSSDINNNNNITINLQLENEQLKNKIQELMNANNNLLLNDKIISGNNNLQNNDFISKIKELTLENQKYKESISKTKESITKLESDINKKNEELEGMKTFIYKLQKELEQKRDEDAKEKKYVSSINIKNENETSCNTEPNRGKSASKKDQNKSFGPKDANTDMINNILNQLNDANKQINTLQKKNKDLQYQLEVKQVEKDLSGFRTEDVNFSNYEEEFDLKKMVNGARDKNRSEDINIDYPGVQGIKDKYKELLQNMNMLEEQVKILLCNISCNNKIKPQITQICQLMRIPAKNIQMIIAGKDKKKALGLMV